MFLVVYVNDIVVTSRDSATIKSIIAKINGFQLKDLGPLNYLLGINVQVDDDCILLGQK